jgi:hypothetical protein
MACGAVLRKGKTFCSACSIPTARKNMIEAAKLGRIATHAPEAEALRSETQRRQMAARKSWQPSEQPKWLTTEFYIEQIQPKLLSASSTVIARILSVSIPYATDIRNGKRRPHPRHWEVLAGLARVQHPAAR